MKINKYKLILIFVIILISTALIVFKVIENRSVVPVKYAKQISFVVYWPKDHLSQPDKNSIKYAKDNSGAQVLSFYDYVNSARVTFVEQATPSSFNDIPDSFTRYINSLNNYQTLSTTYGSVYLTVPPKFNLNTAILNNRGTLLFASSERHLSDDTWRLIFNNLLIVLN